MTREFNFELAGIEIGLGILFTIIGVYAARATGSCAAGVFALFGVVLTIFGIGVFFQAFNNHNGSTASSPQEVETSPFTPSAGPSEQTTVGSGGVHTITAIVNTNLSGYSVYPGSGTLASVRASWDIPPVTCPAIGQPRVVAWVGMWGTNSAVGANASWLPRIGTSSQCDNGTASYSAIWEMDTAFPSSANSDESFQSVPLSVNADDKVSAAVVYLGANSAGEQRFRLTIIDSSNAGHRASEEMSTSVPVPLADIAYQGGAIVEDHNQYGGLANFSQSSIHFTNFTAVGGTDGFNVFEYEMVVNGQTLAQNSDLAGTPGPPPNAANLRVTFLCNGCLGGIACPPPTCLRLPA